MPLYLISCDHCENEYEVFRKIDERNNLPECCGEMMHIKPVCFRVMRDIEPYRAMGTDIATGNRPMITSRSQHREYLQRNGYVELGNDLPKASEKPTASKSEVVNDVKRAISQTGVKL